MDETNDVILTESELEYHARIIEEIAEINSINKEIQRLNSLSVQKSGAAQSWSEHLKAKFSLEDGDMVDDTGRIVKSE